MVRKVARPTPLLGIQLEDQGLPDFQARIKSEINQLVS